MMSEQLLTLEVAQATADVLKMRGEALRLPLEPDLRALAERDVLMAHPPRPTRGEFEIGI